LYSYLAMLGLHKVPQIASLTGLGAVLVALVTRPTLRRYISQTLGLSSPGGSWRAFALLLVLTNLKNFPFVWHVSPLPASPNYQALIANSRPPQFRFFRSWFAHIYLPTPKLTPQSLFEPAIISTRSPLAECDFNFHKSNSTYFSDFDISRTHLVSAILRAGIKKSIKERHASGPPSPAELASKGRDGIALGAVSCHFKHEILPYEKFEIWTRVLCWDHKWMYFVSHMVRPGIARPAHYTLQRGRRGFAQRKGGLVNGEKKEEEQKRRDKLRGAVFASSIAKYVTKKGRLTIPPELVLQRSDMLPPKPEGWVYKGDEGSVNSVELEDALLPAENTSEWTWDTVEAERRRGLRLAEMFGALDNLHEEFDGGNNGVLGEFADIIW
jgi:hypothetical protein